MPLYAYLIMTAGWAIWMTPFFLIRRPIRRAATLDRRARWGIALQGVAYALLWQTRFWERAPGASRIALSVLFLAMSALLSWSGTRALGREWRVDAGLNADHRLVRSGVYRLVRHPIYTSMLCVLLGTGFMFTPLPLLAGSTLVLIAGTEIRVRIEDALLASRFGDEFAAYQRTVPAYLPFLK